MTEWEQCLAEAECRITSSRRAVMEVLQATREPLSPQEIQEKARAIHHPLGLVTVYRTLDLFAELGLVRRVHHSDGCHGYLPATAGHYHALICRGCSHSVEFPGEDDLQSLIVHIEAQTGYRVEEHLLQLSGLCSGCQREGGSDSD
jgi:Fur family ferric uptake transcriptional regulator